MYHAYSSVAAWMIAGGPHIDEPDDRYLQHVTVLRDAKRSANRSVGPLGWISNRLGARPPAPVACQMGNCAPAT